MSSHTPLPWEGPSFQFLMQRKGMGGEMLAHLAHLGQSQDYGTL